MRTATYCSSSTAAILVSTAAVAVAAYTYHHHQIARITKEWQERRQEERTGRIRAEVRLRTLTKESRKNDLQVVGIVTSPYTKRMGTPRQPQLVPSSRGFIEFSVPAASLDGIESYSHVWLIFEFHANTNIDNKRTKIRPPRGNGIKVGQLATRSPHRPNPMGLSLVTIQSWDASTRRLHVRGLDLVHGTPVYDIKPCVPWDIPGYPNVVSSSTVLRVPDWVQQEDSIASVEFTESSKESLKDMVSQGRLAPLYTNDNDGFTASQQTLKEVLAQDPRSSHKGVQARGSTKTQTSYRLVFGQCQVEFVVNEQGVQVVQVSPIDFAPDAYVDGVPLISESSTGNATTA